MGGGLQRRPATPSLDDQLPVTPAERFAPIPDEQRDLVELWLPPTLATTTSPPALPSDSSESTADDPGAADGPDHKEAIAERVDEDVDTVPGMPAGKLSGVLPVRQTGAGGVVEFDRVVPPSGNLAVAGQQFWLGPRRAGLTVDFWADCDVIHLSTGGAVIKTLRSHLNVNDLRRLVADGAVNAGSPPAPVPEDRDMLEVDRLVNRYGMVPPAPVWCRSVASDRPGVAVSTSVCIRRGPVTKGCPLHPEPAAPGLILASRPANDAAAATSRGSGDTHASGLGLFVVETAPVVFVSRFLGCPADRLRARRAGGSRRRRAGRGLIGR